jgi:hypothetical protein
VYVDVSKALVELRATVQPIAAPATEGVIVPTEGEPGVPPTTLLTTPMTLETPRRKLVSFAVVAFPATSVISTPNVFDGEQNSIADIVYIL